MLSLEMLTQSKKVNTFNIWRKVRQMVRARILNEKLIRRALEQIPLAWFGNLQRDLVTERFELHRGLRLYYCETGGTRI